jgi:hypothetical protein
MEVKMFKWLFGGNREGGKGKLTKAGAERLGCPHLAGKVVTFEARDTGGYRVVEGISYDGEYLGSGLAYVGGDAGIEINE